MRNWIAGLATVAVVLVIVGDAWADFVLDGNDVLLVSSNHDTGILYESSLVDVVGDGSIDTAYVNDSSSLVVSGGYVRDIDAYDTSSITVSSGRAFRLTSHDANSVVISGGFIDSGSYHGNTTVHISNAEGGILWLTDAASVTFAGGTFREFGILDSSVVTMLDGSVAHLSFEDESSGDISGGDIGQLRVSKGGSVTIHGDDFRVTDGLGMSDGTLVGTGILTGKWFGEETPWILDIKGTGQIKVQTDHIAPSIHPGDANQDFTFDQLDIVQVLQASKYLSGEPAAWDEGDWNGDNEFDQLDIVSALQSGNYLRRPIAGSVIDAVSAVPEPSALALLSLGVFTVTFGWRRHRVPVCQLAQARLP